MTVCDQKLKKGDIIAESEPLIMVNTEEHKAKLRLTLLSVAQNVCFRLYGCVYSKQNRFEKNSLSETSN